MLKNTSGQHLSFIAIATADGSPVTTGTPTVYLSKDGAAQATSTNTATHLGNGVWVLDLTQTETDADNLSAVMVLTNAINSFAQAFPYVLADFKANVSGLSTFDPATDTVVNVTNVAVCASNSDMRGTDSANTVAPDNAGISANGVAIAALNDFNPATDIVNTVSSVTNAVTTANASDVTSIKTVTDKLDTALVLDGSVYQYTTNALENAPSGGGSAPTEADIYLYFTSSNRQDTFKADTSLLATSASISALNDITAADVFSELTTTSWPSNSFGERLLTSQGTHRTVQVTGSNHVAADVHEFQNDSITASAIAADAVTELQTGLVTVGTAFTYTNGAGDSHNVTIS